MKVSVVVAALNERGFIGRLVDSINDCEYKDKEVIVVDGGSTDGTAEIAKRKGASVVKETGEPRGPSHARNQGVEESDAEIVCVMDADEKVEDGFFENAIKHFENDDVVAVKPGDRPVAIDCFVEKLHAKTYELKDEIFSSSGSDSIPKFYFWRRGAWLDIGGHPESMGWKELVEFRDRAEEYIKENDYKAVVEPKSKVRFHMQHSWSSLLRSFRWYGRSMVDFFKNRSNLGLREIVANLHQPLFFLACLFAIAPIPIIQVICWLVVGFRFLVSVPFSLSKSEPTYLATPLLDFFAGFGILTGLAERVGGKNLSR